MAARALLAIAGLANGVQAQAGGDVVIDPAIFDAGFCGTAHRTKPTGQELNTGTMECGKLMEFVYITRLKMGEQLTQQKGKIEQSSTSTWRSLLRELSRGTSLLSAHTHFLAAISSQRTECFSEHVRLLLNVNLRRMKHMSTSHVKQLWTASQDGTEDATAMIQSTTKWLEEASDLIKADLRTLKSVLSNWRTPSPEEARFYSHEADGRFSTIEMLRRHTFDEFQLDKGLLRGLLRHVLPVDTVVADFGAGSGHYANWLNDTGLVEAFAFDGSPDIELVTKGSVKLADLGKENLQLSRKFDWSLCLEVAENIPPDLTSVFLRNLDSHTKEGLILSWARPGLQGMGNSNPRSEQEVLRLISENTGLHLDTQLTANLRASASLAYLAETVMVLVRNPRSLEATCAPGDDACSAKLGGSSASSPCGTEEGWIFAGNDVQMFPDVPDAATCCELCRSHDNCRFWTWSREESHKDICWIKSTREYRINHDGFVSGVRPS